MGSSLKIKTLKEASLKIEGARLFNSLPLSLRDFKGTKEVFKKNLDIFLETIPDEPEVEGGQVAGTLDVNVKYSNSIKDWMRKLNIYNFKIEEEKEVDVNMIKEGTP